MFFKTDNPLATLGEVQAVVVKFVIPAYAGMTGILYGVRLDRSVNILQ